MTWEVFAARYAEHDQTARDNFLRAPSPDSHDVSMPLDYYVWVLRRAGETIVVDTGFRAEIGARRGRRNVRPVAEALGQLGVDPAAVRRVIVTHLHYDHAGNLDLFPNAAFHLQEREIAFATGRNMCFACMRSAFEVEDVVAMVRALYADRVTFHDGDAEVADGVSVHRVGGHTDGLQMVRVRTERGPVVLTSDASHFYANMAQGNPFPIFFDLGAMAQGWKAARRLADGDETRIIPGHDPDVRRRFPAVEGSGGETVVLHLHPG